MEVLSRWDSRSAAMGFRRRVDRCAMGTGPQHLVLALWAYAGRAFCFKAAQGGIYVGLVLKRPRTRRRRR